MAPPKPPTGGNPHNNEGPRQGNGDVNFSTVRRWMIGKTISVYSPPGHSFTRIYSPNARENEIGVFSGTLLDLVVDATGAPLNALIRYKQKNARRYQQIDWVNIHGLSISVDVEIEYDDDGVSAIPSN
jgi:hypothetical protein